jgi:hypothetical protein
MKKNLIYSVLTLVLFITLLTSCSKDENNPVTADVTDYALAKHWLSLPSPVAINHDVDVFYLYPTSWAKVDTNDPNICEIDNPLMLEYSKGAFLRQASLFDTAANIFAPYYRQAMPITHSLYPMMNSKSSLAEFQQPMR